MVFRCNIVWGMCNIVECLWNHRKCELFSVWSVFCPPLFLKCKLRVCRRSVTLECPRQMSLCSNKSSYLICTVFRSVILWLECCVFFIFIPNGCPTRIPGLKFLGIPIFLSPDYHNKMAASKVVRRPEPTPSPPGLRPTRMPVPPIPLRLRHPLCHHSARERTLARRQGSDLGAPPPHRVRPRQQRANKGRLPHRVRRAEGQDCCPEVTNQLTAKLKTTITTEQQVGAAVLQNIQELPREYWDLRTVWQPSQWE